MKDKALVIEISTHAIKSPLRWLYYSKSFSGKEVTVGATGATVVVPKFSDTLTLFQPVVQILPQHCKGRTKNFPTSLRGIGDFCRNLHVGIQDGKRT